MQTQQKEKLLSMRGGYLSIGITRDGAPAGCIPVPWEKTAHAYAMKLPDVYLTPGDVSDDSIMDILRESHVVGCYIWTPLEDYRFLSCFTELRDVSIREGDGIRDLEFLRPLTECRLLFLQNAKLQNLDVILEATQKKGGLWRPFSCVALYDCTVEDTSRFAAEEHGFSEFLIWQRGGARGQSDYSAIRANTKRYYDTLSTK